MLQTIEVEIDAQGGIHLLRDLPSSNLCDSIGVLKDSPCFNEDPVEIQRKMREEWNDKE